MYEIGFEQFTEWKNIKKAIKLAELKPMTFDDCIKRATIKFYKLYRNNILQLLHVYPLDKLTAEGRPFWSLPKRPPNPLEFDPEDQLHRNFIAAYSCLMAKMYGVELPEDPRSESTKLQISERAK